MDRIRIPLTQGKSALIDARDLPLVQPYRWRAHRHQATHLEQWYAVTTARVSQRQKIPFMFMHRLILRAPMGVEVDHRDHDGLNNTRENLRLSTRQQNLQNRRKDHRQIHPYKGVSFCPWNYLRGRRAKLWRAKIHHQGKNIYLGYFATMEGAALAYDHAAVELFGEYACLNFPLSSAVVIFRPRPDATGDQACS